MEGVEVQNLTPETKECLLKKEKRLHSLPKRQTVNLEFDDLGYNVVLNRRKNGNMLCILHVSTLA